MAYSMFLASVPLAEVAALERDASQVAQSSFVVSVSHVIAYWVKDQPLGQLLGQALDGGRPVNASLWHSLRAPAFHAPQQVHVLHAQLRSAWDTVLAAHPVPEDDWYRIEIQKVLQVYGYAVLHGECVLSALKPPVDRARASRVKIPIQLDSNRA